MADVDTCGVRFGRDTAVRGWSYREFSTRRRPGATRTGSFAELGGEDVEEELERSVSKDSCAVL